MRSISPLYFAIVTSLLTVFAACGQSSVPAAASEPASAPVAVAPAPAVPAPVAPTLAPSAAAGASNFGTMSLSTGFTPDPSKATGTSGGAIAASSRSPACAGWIAETPDHLFVAQTAFGNLRFLVKSVQDVTLVVQRPDGTFACADDTEGTNPIVEGPFAAGTYKIWVGSYNNGVSSAYTLGVTELATVTAEAL